MAKWLSVRLRTKWLWVRAQLQSYKCNIFKSWYFLLKLSFIFCYIICVTVPIKNGVHKKKFVYIKYKALPFNLSFISLCNIKLFIWVRIDMFNDFEKHSLSTDVSLSPFLDITLFLDYLYRSENLNYTVYGTLRLHINIASFPSRHLHAQS